MKRREYFSDYKDAKRPRSRRNWYDEGSNSDDSFKRHQVRKEIFIGDPVEWNDENSHRIHAHKSVDELGYDGNMRRKEMSAASISEGLPEGGSVPFYKDLCISYIPSRIPNSDLEDGLLIEFEKYGRVSVKIINEGVHRRAYIRFAEPDDAKQAYCSIEEHPLLLDNRKVEVNPCFKKTFSAERPLQISSRMSPSRQQPETITHKSRSRCSPFDRPSISPKPTSRVMPQYDAVTYGDRHFSGDKQFPRRDFVPPTRVLFVGNLPPNIQRHALRTMFEQCGQVEDIDIKHSGKFGVSKTFSFIKFSDIDSAQKAKDLFQNSYIGDKQCKIGYGQLDADVIREKVAQMENKEVSLPPRTSRKYKSLLVKPIPNHLLVSHLQETFEGFGSVNIKIATVDGEKVAYVNFQYPEDAKAAFDGSHNLLLAGQPVEIIPFFKSHDDDDRKEKMFPDHDHKSQYHDNQRHYTKDRTKLDIHKVKYASSDRPTKVLFVGNLDSGILKHNLMNIFHEFGAIDDIDIKQSTSKFGKMHAFVTFASVSSAEKAHKEVFGRKIGSHVCKIGYGCLADGTIENKTEEDVDREKSSKGTRRKITGLCITKIPKLVSNKHLTHILETTYMQFSHNRPLTVTIKVSGKHKVALVYFPRSDEATKAFNANIPLNVLKRPVKVAPILSTKRLNESTTPQKVGKLNTAASVEEMLDPELDEKATRTLFVGNLPRDVSEKEVHRRFETFGKIEYVAIKRRGSKAYAFVIYANMDLAFKAKVEMNGKMFNNCKINIGYGKSIITSCLWVGGLGPWVDEDTIRKEFRRFGDIRRIIWPKGSDFAYVQYETNAAAQAACHKFHGWPMGGLDKRLRVDFISVSQILTALEESKKASSQTDADELDKDKSEELSEVASETSEEEEAANENETSMENETAMANERSVSNISDDSLIENLSSPRSQSPHLTESENAASRSASVHSDRESVDDGNGIWAQPNESSLLIKTPFSPADEIPCRLSERSVFIQSKGKFRNYDQHMHHQTHHRKPNPRDSPSPRRVGESLQREIKHYRKESSLPKYTQVQHSKDSSRPESYRYSGRPEDFNNKHRDRSTDRVEPESARHDAEQYKPIIKHDKHDKEYERRKESHQDSRSSRRDFAGRDGEFHSGPERLNDFKSLDNYERHHQELPLKLSPGHSGKPIEYSHGIRNYFSDVRENTDNADVGGSPDVLGFERSFQYENSVAFQRQVPLKIMQQEPVTPYNNPRSSSFEFSKAVNRLPDRGNSSSDVNRGNFEPRPEVFHYPINQKAPISYGDPVTVGSPQSFQQTMPDRSFGPQGNIASISGPGNSLNVPRMITPVQSTPFQAGDFHPRPKAPTFPPERPSMVPPPVTYSRTNFSHIGQRGKGVEGHYSRSGQPQRGHPNPKGPGPLPWHIQQ